MAAKGGECIQVVVRCRPFNRKETEEKRTNIVDIDIAARQVAIRNAENPEDPPRSFTFDSVYDENALQKAFYEESCFGLVENVLEGFNGTIFAYGQTGCGKSWTMQGPANPPPELRGVIPNSFTHIFDSINASKGVEFLVRCSYLEIYNEEIRDLLCDPKLRVKCDLREDPQRGVFVNNLSDVVVETEKDLQAMLDKGLHFRTVASTLMNTESSRSHSIFTVVVEMSTKDATGKDHIRAGKLNLVDLAGSERQKKTGATGATLKEGSKINLSLSALGNVISALAENKGKHIPYRDSKLTRLLQDSLGGNTKTLMIAAVSPADYNFEETLSTLRYANRAKNIQNKPKINEDPKDTLLREYKAEIERLKQLLEQHMQSGGGAAEIAAAMQGLAMMTAPPSYAQPRAVQEEDNGNIGSEVNNDGDDNSNADNSAPPKEAQKRQAPAAKKEEAKRQARAKQIQQAQQQQQVEDKSHEEDGDEEQFLDEEEEVGGGDGADGNVVADNPKSEPKKVKPVKVKKPKPVIKAEEVVEFAAGGDEEDEEYDEDENIDENQQNEMKNESTSSDAPVANQPKKMKKKSENKNNIASESKTNGVADAAANSETDDSQSQRYEQQALQEYSQAVVAQRDEAAEQLRVTKEEMEKERRLRQEMAEKLLQLEAKLMRGAAEGGVIEGGGDFVVITADGVAQVPTSDFASAFANTASDPATTSSIVNNNNNNNNNNSMGGESELVNGMGVKSSQDVNNSTPGVPSSPKKTAEDAEERAKKFRERKQRAKLKQQQKEEELRKVKDEKQA